MMTTEKFELVGKDARDYFATDADVNPQKGDSVIIELDHERKTATWMIVPEGKNAGNYVPTDDDYDGVVAWLNEHDYRSEDIEAARRSQIGLCAIVGGDRERKDILELDELSDDALKANFGYTDAGIENLRDQANEVRKEEAI